MVEKTKDVKKLPPLSFTYEPTELTSAQKEAARIIFNAVALWLARPAVPADERTEER